MSGAVQSRARPASRAVSVYHFTEIGFGERPVKDPLSTDRVEHCAMAKDFMKDPQYIVFKGSNFRLKSLSQVRCP